MTFTCTTCGAPAMAIKSGTEDVTCELLGQIVALKRGVPTEAWCETCWKTRFRHREIAA